MKKLQSFALYALVTPAIALGAGSVLADENIDKDVELGAPSNQEAMKASNTSDQDVGEAYDGDKLGEPTESQVTSAQDSDDKQQNTQSDKDGTQSFTRTTESDQNMDDQAHMQNKGYLDSAPANSMRTDDLIGAKVKTSANEEVGSVNELIIDENGQVVAIVVGVGGFLGMGERDVAIGWDDVKRSGSSDELELWIDATRDDLSAAPKFEMQD